MRPLRIEIVHGVADDAEAHTVREPLEEGAQLRRGLLQRVVGSEGLVGVLALVSGMATVRGVLLEEVDEPADGLLVVLVLLALDDDLREYKRHFTRTRNSDRPSCHGR